jgi:hypothetical protein
MKKKESQDIRKMQNLPGYPEYPESEDIFDQNDDEVPAIPEDMTVSKEAVNSSGEEEDMENMKPGEDLDVPGSELDDEEESIGSEDEENNYYSLGGDDHSDLEEDR